MKYMLDTNSCIFLIRRKYPSVLETLMKKKPGDVALSSLTVAELHYGVEKSSAIEKNKEALGLFLTAFEILDFDTTAAEVYGRIRSSLEKIGKPIGSIDMLIAAHAVSQDLILVTHGRDFDRISKLKTQDWVVE
ncbi:type II toxin-antitoxin system tRNA(fMet)-specific endonuclease VapC [Oligoflexus tunisiensis]|uniref:type II toxin-antitoxin system tRNA(fMet)-specific endonuclease VapC n=1 Tax=Oligoflexus tunisiensis TaxID=708132 RepID=UPI00114CFCBF|nr:type II toxin-antitoxin system VapC family toxin [Oligoflexus tunisiensis]